jgi:hypothetical protein
MDCDYILLAGQQSPGLVEVVGASSPREWDKRKGYGVSGAYSVFIGQDLSEFAVRLRFSTALHWAEWATWKKLVDKLPKKRFGSGKDSGMLDIWHPVLEDVGIKAVGVADRKAPEQTADGEWTIEIKFIEFRRPKLSLAKPEGAAATPVDPVDEKIGGLLKQLDALAGDNP